ncbi:MAG: hypothetical protein ABJ013_06310 [Halioglobus sp.]
MKTLIAIMTLLLCSSSALAERCAFDDATLGSRPLQAQGPTDVAVRVYLNDVISIHDVDQSFVADVVFRAEWQDPRLRHELEVPCRAEVDEIWTPVLQLLNQRSLESIRAPELLVSPDGSVVSGVRAFGEFSYRADLSNFPFDKQELSFKIVSTYGPEDVRLISRPEMFELAEQLSISNWNIEIEGSSSKVQYISAVDKKLDRIDLIMRAERLAGYYTWQQLLPLLLVVMMTWVTFWIPEEFVPPRVGLAATSMLTLIAYRFAMSSVLPPIAYLTRLDVFMIGASILVFAGLAATVAVSYFGHNNNREMADTVNRSARWMSPLLMVMLIVFSFFA